MKTKNELKKGISLIVLVITIIVTIILAAAVIISLSNNGIIGKANESVDTTNLKNVQQAAQVIWSDVYLENLEGANLDYETEVAKRLEEQNIDITKYDINADDNGVTVELKGSGEVAEEIWTQIVGEVTLTNAGTDESTGVTTFMLTPGYNIDKVYRLYVESPAYKGSVELTPFADEAENYYSGFYITEDKEMIQVFSLEDAYPYLQGIQAGTIKGEMWINYPTMNAFVVYTTIGKSTDTYKIIKIEKSTKEAINKYGFYYRTIYAFQLFESDAYIYFRPDNTCICFSMLETGPIADVKSWEITETGKIKTKLFVSDFEFEIDSPNELKLEDMSVPIDLNKKVPVVKSENGIYLDAFYFVKNLEDTSDDDNTIALLCTFSDTQVFDYGVEKGKGSALAAIGRNYDISDYEILNDGKTLKNGNIIYELPENLYEVQ